jgi:hypothetical protein
MAHDGRGMYRSNLVKAAIADHLLNFMAEVSLLHTT